MSKGINQSLAWVIAFITSVTLFLFGAFIVYRTNIKTVAARSNQVDHINSLMEDKKSLEKATKASHGEDGAFAHEEEKGETHGSKNREASSLKDGEHSEAAEHDRSEKNMDSPAKMSGEGHENIENHEKKNPN